MYWIESGLSGEEKSVRGLPSYSDFLTEHFVTTVNASQHLFLTGFSSVSYTRISFDIFYPLTSCGLSKDQLTKKNIWFDQLWTFPHVSVQVHFEPGDGVNSFAFSFLFPLK